MRGGSMNVQLIVAGVIAASSFGMAWQVQDWRFTSKEAKNEKQRYEDTIELQRLASRAQAEQDQRIVKAQSDARLRERDLRAAVDSSRDAVERLSYQSTTAVQAARTNHATCLIAATAQQDVLDKCSREYRGLAETADRHTSDIQTIIEAVQGKKP